jgi:hypothetical protein
LTIGIIYKAGVPTRSFVDGTRGSTTSIGGNGKAFAGHGEYRIGSGYTTVPEGTTLIIPRDGIAISDLLTGQALERGAWWEFAAAKEGRLIDDAAGMRVLRSGSKVDNYTLLPQMIKCLKLDNSC